MTASLYEMTGISISAFTPLIDLTGPTYNPRSQLVDALIAEKTHAYSQEILANGGWWSASIQLSGTEKEIEDWFEFGLNRHIEVYDSALVRIFQGFVNHVSIRVGTLSATRGPLLDIANRLSVTYSPILDATTNPPIIGDQTTTTVADDTDSQSRYAIVEKVLSGGRLLDDGTTDEAEQIRDTALAEMAEPETGQDLSLSSSEVASATLTVIGYVQRMSGYVYQDLTAATIQLDTKLQSVISADPNGILSTDYTDMDANAFLVSREENDNKMGWDVVAALVSIGDVSDARYTFGIYDEMRARYRVVPATTRYQHRILGENMEIQEYNTGSVIAPWDVIPAEWVFLPDFLVGFGKSSSRRLDPRYMFIESVKYTMPYGLELNGNKIGRLAQILAKKGMSG